MIDVVFLGDVVEFVSGEIFFLVGIEVLKMFGFGLLFWLMVE